MTVHVSLTIEHIKKGCDSRHGGSCPMYFAISEALKNPKIHISAEYVNISSKPSAVCYLLPLEARSWIARWDESFHEPERNWERFEPIEFELEMYDAV